MTKSLVAVGGLPKSPALMEKPRTSIGPTSYEVSKLPYSRCATLILFSANSASLDIWGIGQALL